MVHLCDSSIQIRYCTHWSSIVSLLMVKRLCMLDKRFVWGKIIEKVVGDYLIEFQTLPSKLHCSFIREQFRIRHEMYSFTWVPMSIAIKGLVTCHTKIIYLDEKIILWSIKMNIYKFAVYSLNVIKTNRKSIEFTSDLNGLIDKSSAFFGEPSSSKNFFFLHEICHDGLDHL